MNIKILGDVHAGRKFLNDVPLHRRGEREEEVFKALEESLYSGNEDLHFQVGDLFDSFDTDKETIDRVASIYERAAKALPSRRYVVYPGNHDRSKDDTKVSAFHLFTRIVAPVTNIWVIEEPSVVFMQSESQYGVIPWHPFKSSKQLAEELVKYCEGRKLKAVFTHCDTGTFGNSDFNLLQTQILSQVTDCVYNGHVHTPSVFKQHGVTVNNVGSMQPYSHGEDPTSSRYLTVSLDEFSKLSPSDIENKYIRVRLSKGESPPESPNCMGFKIIYESEEQQESESLVVEFEDFNTRSLFVSCLTELKVSDKTQKLILEKFDAETS